MLDLITKRRLFHTFSAAALRAMHGQASDIFVHGLNPPELDSPAEVTDYYDKRVRQLATTACDIAEAMIAEIEKREGTPD